MIHEFRHLHMSAELACEFLAVFSRMEYALKVSGYTIDRTNRVEANWDRFANEINELFLKAADGELKESVDYLLKSPPRKQVIRAKVLMFDDQKIDDAQTVAQQCILMIRTVRNNLFHGGKMLPDGELEEGRNQRLVFYSLVIMKACSVFNREVRRNYER